MFTQGGDHCLERAFIGVHAAGSDPARRHRVDPHPGVPPFIGGGLGEIVHSRARRTGVAHAGHAAPHVGEHVDDAAAVAAHGLVEHFPGHEEAAHQIGAQHGFETLLVDRGQGRRVLAAGIVHQAMDRTKALHQPGHQGLDRFLVADVAGLPVGLAAVLGNFAGDLLQFFRLAPHQQHLGPQGRQFVGSAAADTAAAAGDDDGLAGEQLRFENRVVHHGSSFN